MSRSSSSSTVRVHQRPTRARGRSSVAVLSTGVLAAGALATALAPAGAADAPPAPWSPAELVTTMAVGADEGDGDAMIDVGPDGSATAVWRVPRPAGGERLVVAVRGSGGGWTAPHTLPGRLVREAAVDVATTRGGRASLVRERRVEGAWQVEAVDCSVAGCTAPVRLGAGRSPEAAVDHQGLLTVVWRSGDALVLRQRTTGGTWRAARAVPARGLLAHEVAVDAAGDTAVVWSDTGGRRVRGLTREAGGSWQRPTTLMTGRRAPYLGLVVDALGRATAVWSTTDEWDQRRREYRNGIVWARTDVRGRWLRARYANRTVGEDGMLLDVAMSPRGDGVAVWLSGGQGGGDPYTTDAVRFGSKGTWGPSLVVARDWRYPAFAWVGSDRVARLLAESAGSVRMREHRLGAGWSAWSPVVRGDLADASGSRTRWTMLWFGDGQGSVPLWSSHLGLMPR